MGILKDATESITPDMDNMKKSPRITLQEFLRYQLIKIGNAIGSGIAFVFFFGVIVIAIILIKPELLDKLLLLL